MPSCISLEGGIMKGHHRSPVPCQGLRSASSEGLAWVLGSKRPGVGLCVDGCLYPRASGSGEHVCIVLTCAFCCGARICFVGKVS